VLTKTSVFLNCMLAVRAVPASKSRLTTSVCTVKVTCVVLIQPGVIASTHACPFQALFQRHLLLIQSDKKVPSLTALCFIQTEMCPTLGLKPLSNSLHILTIFLQIPLPICSMYCLPSLASPIGNPGLTTKARH
jgi:hypothetical protein